jgi:hypothetical protein
MTEQRPEAPAPESGTRYVHKECGGVAIWDLSGGFCERCHAEGLDTGDVERQQPEAPAVPGVTRWQTKPVGPVEVEACRVLTSNVADWPALAEWCGGIAYTEETPWDYNAGAVVMPDGHRAFVHPRDWGVIVPTPQEGRHKVARYGWWIVKSANGVCLACDPEFFTATYEPAPEPLTATQLDHLRQMAGEDAITTVGRGLDLAVKLGGAYPEVAQTVAAARQALRVLGSDEPDAEPAAASRETLEALPVAAARERIRILAQSWASLPDQGDDHGEMIADVDRRVGAWLLGVLDGDPALAVEGARILAEGWMKPGGKGLFYPAAGQAVLDAIRGASTETEASWRARAEAAEAKLAEIRDLVEAGWPGLRPSTRLGSGTAVQRILAITGTDEEKP